jgi:hypothetical protein
MNKWTLSVAFGAAGLALCAVSLTPAQALTSKECSAKYKEAKSAGSLNGMKYKDFRKAQCGAEAAAAPVAQPASAPAATPMKASSRKASRAAKNAEPLTPSNAVFPRAVSPKYSSESAGKAREHTCLDQYHANKDTNGNGGLKWIQKGGGYYSECNKRLKGA